MTELLYTVNSYVRVFEATVMVQVDGGVVLDRTAFYPGGGGQPCDFGSLAAEGVSWVVTKVKKVKGEVVHFLSTDVLPAVGQGVTGTLDWERRYALMRYSYGDAYFVWGGVA